MKALRYLLLEVPEGGGRRHPDSERFRPSPRTGWPWPC